MNNQESRNTQEYQYRLQMIPVLIGLKELEHCLNFADDNCSPQTYILSNNNNATLREDEGLRLIQFLLPSADILKSSQTNSYPLLFQTDDGEDYLFIKKIEITNPAQSDTSSEETKNEVEHYELTISLDSTKTTEEEVNNINETLQNNRFDIKTDKYGAEKTLVIIYKNRGGTSNTIIDIEFVLNGGKRKIQLCVCEDTHISDVVLDCGSESTQYLRYDRGRDEQIGERNIGLIRTYMQNCFLDDGENVTFVQEYSTERKLYRSLYYYQPQARNADTNNIIEPSSKFKAGITEQNKQPEQNTEQNTKPEQNTEQNTKPKQNTEQGTKQKQILYIQTTENCIRYKGTDSLYDKGFRTLPLIKIPQAERFIKINESDKRDIVEENPFDFREYYFFRSIICQYARCIFYEILTSDDLNSPRFVVFNILVPYVFNHKQLLKLKSLLRDDIKKIIDDLVVCKENIEKRIKAVEIQFVYESDAPALGAISITEHQEPEYLPNGNILLLDAGKGTLDISIIKYNSKQEFICKYRTGICGAGNTLTHAYLCALVADYLQQYSNNYSNNDVKEYIYNLLYHNGKDQKNNSNTNESTETEKGTPQRTNTETDTDTKEETDTYFIYQMYQAVEDFKKGKYKTASFEKCDAGKSITDFKNYIKTKGNGKLDCFKTQEAKNYILNCIEFLCREVVNSIKDVILSDERENKIDYIIFAGRAFKLSNFQLKLKEKLKETNILNPDKQEHEFKYNTNTLKWLTEKNVALCIAYETKDGNYYNIPNMPMIKKKITPWIPGISDKIFKFIQKLFRTNEKQTEREKWVSLYNIMKNNPLVSSRPNIKLEEEDLYKYGLHHGFDINFSAINDKIYYNHYFFHVSGERAVRERIGSGKMKLFIVNGDFYIRKIKKNKNKSRCIKLEFEGYTGEDNLLANITNFPNITINSAKDVPTITAEDLEIQNYQQGQNEQQGGQQGGQQGNQQGGQQGSQQTGSNKPQAPAHPEENNNDDDTEL